MPPIDREDILSIAHKIDDIVDEIDEIMIDINIIRNNPNIDLYEGEIVKIMNKTGNYHIVKPLETLNTIAQKYGTTIEELIKVNNLNSKRLFIGQSLKINQF